MRGRLVAGQYLVLSEASAQRWIKKRCIDYPTLPLYYPCLVRQHICADESTETRYTYLIDVDNMRAALLGAMESVPTVNQQRHAARGFAHIGQDNTSDTYIGPRAGFGTPPSVDSDNQPTSA